jgi:hypothetical protein
MTEEGIHGGFSYSGAPARSRRFSVTIIFSRSTKQPCEQPDKDVEVGSDSSTGISVDFVELIRKMEIMITASVHQRTQLFMLSTHLRATSWVTASVRYLPVG